jgi:hypothetical protein
MTSASSSPISRFFSSLRAVLWGFIGLGGRQADAGERVQKGGMVSVIVIALVLVLLFVVTLIGVAKLAAGT